MTLVITPKTDQQQIAAIPVSGRVIIQPNIWYTCPAGKRAICKGRVVCTGQGGATEMRFSAAGIIMFRWEIFPPNLGLAFPDGTSQITNTVGVAQNPFINIFRLFDVELAAGETIETSQNAFTNAEFNLWMEVIELAE